MAGWVQRGWLDVWWAFRAVKGVDAWLVGCMHGWMGACIVGWVHGGRFWLGKECMHGWLGACMVGWVHAWLVECMHGWLGA